MRKAPPLKLEQSPLVLVLCQVRFPALLGMQDYVATIQADLREQGYTRFSQERIQQVAFGGGEIKTNLDTRWVFPNRAFTEAVVLAPNFVLYQTSDYDVFETFVERLSGVIDAVAKATRVDFADQAGLRYVDLIRPAGDRSASEFLREQVRGLASATLGARVARQQFITQAQSDFGELFVRSFESSGPDFMPPDLVSTHLKLKPDPKELADETYRVLDIDHIARREIEFASAPLAETLWMLHDASSRAFRAAVTAEALEFWREKV